jgi:hypothetical protein
MAEVLDGMNVLQALKAVKDDEPEYTYDDVGRAYRVWPLHARRERIKRGQRQEKFDENVTPCYNMFNAEGRNIMVTRDAFDARDKKAWFPTLKEAIDSKTISLAKKKKEVEKKLDELDAKE